MKSKPAINDTEKKRVALRFLTVALILVAFLAAIPWLKTTLSDPMVMLVSTAVAIFVMGYGTYFIVRWQRGLDEVHRASSGFAAQWAMHAGQFAFVLLMLLPPFKDFATAVVSKFAGDPGMTVDGTVVVFAMTLGFVGVTLLQAIATSIFSVIWWKSKQ